MEIAPLQHCVVASDVSPERLAGNAQLSEREKIHEASRQFEAMLLRQILQSTQKTVIRSKYADDSTAASIYHDLVTERLADSISKSGAFGLARTFEQQLNRPQVAAARDGSDAVPTAPTTVEKRTATRPHLRPMAGTLIPSAHE